MVMERDENHVIVLKRADPVNLSTSHKRMKLK
jgi:hypothetical protein